jgi:predicted acetyltransferase
MQLVDPQPRFRASFLEAVDEYVAEGDTRFTGLVSWPAEGDFPGIEFTAETVDSDEGFLLFTDYLVAQREPDAPRPPAFVPATIKWLGEGDTYLGTISLRHELTPPLLAWGGHIGYGVRPSARRRGHATAALAVMLPVAAARGIGEVLVTCDVDNVASKRVIERNGGVYEDTREGKLRFWVPTHG